MPSSAISIDVLDPVGDRDWDREVLDHQDHSIFHSSAWAQVLKKTYGHHPHYIRIQHRNQTRSLIPLMEVRSRITGSRVVSLPFSDFCGPLCFGQFDQKEAARLLGRLAEEKNWKRLEIRSNGPGCSMNVSEEETAPLATNPAYYAHTLDLRGGEETVWNGLAASTKRSIRKARREQVKFRSAHSEDAMQEFYQLHTATRRRHGLPPQPYSFFLNILKEIMSTSLPPDSEQSGPSGFVSFADHGNRALAATVFLSFGKSAVYKFGASRETHVESSSEPPRDVELDQALDPIRFPFSALWSQQCIRRWVAPFQTGLGVPGKNRSAIFLITQTPGAGPRYPAGSAGHSPRPFSGDCLSPSIDWQDP